MAKAPSWARRALHLLGQLWLASSSPQCCSAAEVLSAGVIHQAQESAGRGQLARSARIAARFSTLSLNERSKMITRKKRQTGPKSIVVISTINTVVYAKNMDPEEYDHLVGTLYSHAARTYICGS